MLTFKAKLNSNLFTQSNCVELNTPASEDTNNNVDSSETIMDLADFLAILNTDAGEILNKFSKLENVKIKILVVK